MDGKKLFLSHRANNFASHVSLSGIFGHNDDGDERDGEDPHEGEVDEGRGLPDLASEAVFVVAGLERVRFDGRVVPLGHQDLKCLRGLRVVACQLAIGQLDTRLKRYQL